MAFHLSGIPITTSAVPTNISTASSVEPRALPDIGAKMLQMRPHFLATIRCHMPITTLFTPALKIDLRQFLNSQNLIQYLAITLHELRFSHSVDCKQIAVYLSNTPVLATIQSMFKKPELYMQFLYEACADVLNQKEFANDLQPALQGRIFTLNNALIAQKDPQFIIKEGQEKHGILPQTEDQVKKEGAAFIRECLRLYLHAMQKIPQTSFEDLLTTNACQLIPFVREVTKLYLREKGKACPEDPLTFRNLTGYNYHGLVAATVMNVGLKVLGYETCLLGRNDLDPRLTHATRHNIIEVTAPDESTYVVDPSYIQFHKEILDESQLPKVPVLVLSDFKVEKYVEDALMVHWKKNAELVKSRDQTTIHKLWKQNQLLPYMIEKYKNTRVLSVPSNPENWVRASLRSIWDCNAYRPICSDEGFQEIFCPSNSHFSTISEPPNTTYQYVKDMGITLINNPLSNLKILLKNLPPNIHKNSDEALTFIAHIPLSQREEYAFLFDVDPRINMDIILNAYFRSLKKLVNPKGEDKSVIYGCSGADCTSVMLATDAATFTFVDITPLSFDAFKSTLAKINGLVSYTPEEVEVIIDEHTNFLKHRNRYRFGGTKSFSYPDGTHAMPNLPLKLFFDLQSAGVNLQAVSLSLSRDQKAICIEFPWQYYGKPSSRMRTITLISADLTKPSEYPSHLKNIIDKGFDIFYMKAAFNVPKFYPQFLPHLAKSLKDGGWLMTTDKTFMMEEFDSYYCLYKNGLEFEIESGDMDIEEVLLRPPFNPFEEVSSLEEFPPIQRVCRLIEPDITYWSLLKLQRKGSRESSSEDSE